MWGWKDLKYHQFGFYFTAEDTGVQSGEVAEPGSCTV